MKYEIIFENGRYAMIKRGTNMDEYAVVSGLDKETGEWGHTVTYAGFGGIWRTPEPVAMAVVLDRFLGLTNKKYITRERSIEIATKQNDFIQENCDQYETEELYIHDICITPEEIDFFGTEVEFSIEDDEEEEEFF